MTKKTLVIFIVMLVSFILAMVIVSTNSHTSQNKAKDMMNHIDDALDDNWNKQAVTEVYDLVYSDKEGNTIVYYICVTAYHGADSDNQAGLNTNAIASVADPDEAESYRECTVSDLPAAIYQKDGRSYLCWTVTSELSCVIEYDPDAESEADIFRMAESVPINTLHCSN